MGIKSSLAKAIWREIKSTFLENLPQLSQSNPPYSAPLPESYEEERRQRSHRSAPPRPSNRPARRAREPSSRTHRAPKVSQPPPPPSDNRYATPLPENFDYSRDVERLLNSLLEEVEGDQEKSANRTKQNAVLPKVDLSGEIQRPQVTFNAPPRSVNGNLKVCRELPSLEPPRPRQSQQRRAQNYADYYLSQPVKPPTRPEVRTTAPATVNSTPKRSNSRRIIPSPETSPLTLRQISEAFTALDLLFGDEIPYAVTGSAAQCYHTSQMIQPSAFRPTISEQRGDPTRLNPGSKAPLPDHLTLLCPSSSSHALRAWALARGAVSLPNRASFGMHLPGKEGISELRKINVRAVGDLEWEALIAQSHATQNGARIILVSQLRK